MEQTIMTGTVESVNGSSCNVRVKGRKTVLASMRALKTATYWLPLIGDKVVCIVHEDGSGFILGTIQEDAE